MGISFCRCSSFLSFPLFTINFVHSNKVSITHHRPMILSYTDQSTDLDYMSIDWFLYNANFGLKWVKIIWSVSL